MTAINAREKRWTEANGYADQTGQRHFPDTKLDASEIDPPTKKRRRI